MLIAVAAVILSLVILTYGADRFVDGAAAAARNWGVSPMLVGLIIVGFATSAPEMLVAGVASLDGDPDIAIGNAIGSNIANIGLVLGITALVCPLFVKSSALRNEFPVMFVAMGIAAMVMWDHELTRLDGVILAVSMFAVLGFIAWLGIKSHADDALNVEFEQQITTEMSTRKALMCLALGLVLLIAGSRGFVWGAVQIAQNFGVSDLVIGLTIVAIGTSLPELAASTMSALKGEPEIALGNVIGSNIFNVLGVLCVPAIIFPSVVPEVVLSRDMAVMFVLSIALLIMAIGFRGQGRINRFEGVLLLSAFCYYQWLLFATPTAIS